MNIILKIPAKMDLLCGIKVFAIYPLLVLSCFGGVLSMDVFL